MASEMQPNYYKSGELLANDMTARVKRQGKAALAELHERDPEIAELADGRTTVFSYWSKCRQLETEVGEKLQELKQLQAKLAQENEARLRSLMARTRALDEAGVVEVHYAHRIRPDQVKKALRALGVKAGDTIFVHSKLSGLGYIDGGIERVIAELRDTVGKRGTLAMPTFSQNYPGMIEEPYDPKASVSTAGRITDAFWRMPGVLRSDNPCHSIAAIGPNAECLTAPHGSWDMFDRGGPFGRLYDLNAWIIMLGCSLAANTMLHAVEAWALPYPPPNFVFAKGKDGGIKKVVCNDFPEWCREWYGKFEEGKIQKRLFARGVIAKRQLGRGTIYAMQAKRLVDTCLRVLKKEPDVFLCDRPNCRTCWPCKAMLVGWEVPDRI